MRALRPNLYPYGRELRKWMLGQEWWVPVFSAGNVPFTNPYTEDVAVLTAAYMRVTNDGAFWAETSTPSNWVSSEISRIRLYSEFILYTVRLSEALVKQLLFCTDFEARSYRRDPIGSLLFKDCKACRKEGKPHSTSLLGSLAHRYGFCAGYGNCLDIDLPKLASSRNRLVAHSETWQLRQIDVATSKADLHRESIETGETFIHMLEHIGAIETAMLRELTSHIVAGTPVEHFGAASIFQLKHAYGRRYFSRSAGTPAKPHGKRTSDRNGDSSG